MSNLFILPHVSNLMSSGEYLISKSALESYSRIAFGHVYHYLDDKNGVMKDIRERVKMSVKYEENLAEFVLTHLQCLGFLGYER